MTNAKRQAAQRIGRRAGARPSAGGPLAAALLLLGIWGCGPEATDTEVMERKRQGQQLSSFNGLSVNGLSVNGLSVNGLSVNGLSVNGLSVNGLSVNGLSVNGLSVNGLSSAAFSGWFSKDPALSDMVMSYLVRCALPSGQSRSYTDSGTGQSYTWSGALGLAPGWAGGLAPTQAEQQVITACMLAHLNRYGLTVPISVLGRSANSALISYSVNELLNFPVHEACFFGNAFTGEGLFFGVDMTLNDEGEYLTRACATLGGAGSACEPLEYVGSCWKSCQLDPQGEIFYSKCTRNGVEYKALTTRMRLSDFKQLFPGSSP